MGNYPRLPGQQLLLRQSQRDAGIAAITPTSRVSNSDPGVSVRGGNKPRVERLAALVSSPPKNLVTGLPEKRKTRFIPSRSGYSPPPGDPPPLSGKG
jgi:hypothetical protein